MGTLSAIAFTATTLTKNTKIALAIVAAVAIVLLIAILVLSRRRRSLKASSKEQGSAAPDGAATMPMADSFTPNGSGPVGVAPGPLHEEATSWAPPAPPPPPPPPPPPSGNPPPGTPAGWLPEPGGTPDTLRYWDGFTWTQHVAQRT